MGVIYETSSSSSKWNIWETIVATVLRRSSGIGSSSSRRRQAALFGPRTQPTTRRMSNAAKATAAAAGLTLAVLYAVGGTTPGDKGSNNRSSATTSDSLKSTLYSWYAYCREYVAKNKNGLLLFGLGGGGSADAEDESSSSSSSPGKQEPEDRTIVTHEGSCHCEAVAFEVRAPRTLHVRDIDHCASSATTLPQQHYPRARVKTSAFRLQPGCETSIQTYRVNDTAFSFCRQCGVPILTAVSLTLLPPRHESSSSSSSIALYINVDCLRPGSWIRKTIPKSKREHRAQKEYSGCQNQQPGGNKIPTKTESSSSPSVTTTTTTTSSSGSSGGSSEVLLSTIMGGEGSSMSSLHHNGGGGGGHVDWPGGDAEEASHSEVSSTTSAFSSCGDDDYPQQQEYSDLGEKSPERLGLAPSRPPAPRDHQPQQFLTAANDMTKHAQLRQFMKKYSGSSSSEDHHPRQITGKNNHHRHIA